MAWRDDREQARKIAAQQPVRLDQDRLLASMGRGSGDKRAPSDRRPQHRQAFRIGRRVRHVELEVARDHDPGRPEVAITLRMRGRLREAQLEAAQQRADGGGHAPPAIERALGDPCVDKNQGNAALSGRYDQVRPEIRLNEEREIGLPMIEEAFDEPRRVQDHELVDHALRQALLGKIGRRHRARGAQHSESFFTDALDQRDHRNELPDAGAMQPHQGAARARELALAVAFVEPRGMLLAALQPMRHERGRKRRRRRCQQAVGMQCQRQPLRHVRPAPAADPRARRRALSPHSATLRARTARFRAPRRPRRPQRGSAHRRHRRRGRTED